MTWSIENSRDIKAPADSLWRWYSDPVTWPDWAHNTKSVSFDGEVSVGAEGRVTPRSGPAQRVRIIELVPERVLARTATRGSWRRRPNG